MSDTRKTTLPGIPPAPPKADPHTRAWMLAVKEALEVRLGRRGDPLDRGVTLRELNEAIQSIKAAQQDASTVTTEQIVALLSGLVTEAMLDADLQVLIETLDQAQVPRGGGADQVLTKSSSTDWDMAWTDASAGGFPAVSFSGGTPSDIPHADPDADSWLTGGTPGSTYSGDDTINFGGP